MQSQQDKSEAEDVVCRICRLEAEPDNLLFHPCKCSGTIKFVHQDCLNQWLKHSGHIHCEVCKHKFSFTPLYAPDAPPNLPWLELAWGLGQRGAGGIRVGLRVLLVIFVWLSVVPLSTCWLWRLGFTRSLSEALNTLRSRIHPVLLFADCVQGSLISSVLIFLVLFVGYVWDQVRVYWTMRQAEQLQQQQQRPLQQPRPQAPPPLRLVDRVRQQQQREQRPQEPANAASARAAWLAAKEAAERRHDSRAEQAGPSQEAPQLPDASFQGNLQREAEQPALSGTAVDNAAVLGTLLAELPTTTARQAGRADTALAGGGQLPRFGAAAAVSGDGAPQQAALAAESSSNLHSSVGSRSAEAPTLQQGNDPGTSAHMLENQPANAARLEQQVAASDQQTTALPQPASALMQKTHHMDQPQALVPEQLGRIRQQERRFLPQQQAPALKQLGGEPAQLAASVHRQADAAPLETGTAAAAAVLDEQAVRRQQEQAVMLPQPVVPLEQPVVPIEQPAVPIEQPAVPIEQPRVPIEQPAVPLEQPAVPLEQALALVGPQQRQAAAALNDEPMAFEELVGLRGPIRLLFENAGTVIFSSAMFMAAALWAPFTWGRITIRGIAMAQTAWKLTVLPAAAMQLLLKNYQASADTQNALLPGQGDATADYNQSLAVGLQQAGTAGPSDNVTAQVVTLERLAHDLQHHLAGPDLSDWLCLAVGYLSLACVAFTAAWLMVSWKVLWQHWRPRLLTQHSVLHLLHRLLQDVWTKLTNSAGLVAVMAKVMVVLVTELVVLPVAYGFWLDVCALPLFEGSLQQRLALLRSAPLTWTLLHWMLGMACLMVTAAFLSVVRGVLRPGALPWLKDPFDPEGEPLQQVLASNVFLQLQREVVSLASMSCLAVILVHLPIKLATAVAPSLFPFSFHSLDTVTEVPADMLLLHVCLPFTLPHLHVRQWSKATLSWWLRKVARPLEIEHYLLPPRPPQQPGPRPHPQQLPAAPAPAQPVAAPPQPSPSAQVPQHTASTSSETPSVAEEARPEQQLAAFSELAPVFGSQEVSQAAVRHNHMHHQQVNAGSEDGEDMVSGMSGDHAPHQADLHPGRSAQPQSPLTTQPSASSHADVACETSQEGFSARRALEEGNKLRDMHSSESWHGLLSESEGGGEGEHSQQIGQASTAFSHREDQPEVCSLSWEDLQADSRPQDPAQSSAQAGSSTETDAQAEAVDQGELPEPAHLLSDGMSRASPAETQSSVASGAGQLPSPGAQAAPLGVARGAAATAEGLAANMQLDDSDELTSQLLTVAALLMLTLLLFMTGLLTLPCIIGRALLRSVNAPLRHDLYCAVLGAYAIWGAAAAATRLHGLVQRTRGGRAMLTELQGWVLTLARLGLLAFLTLIVIPFMAGLYLDLVMLLFRVRGSESPVIFIYQDWACGVLLTKICYKIVTSEGNLPQSLTKARDRVQLVQRIGLLQVPFMLAFKELLWPVLKPLLLLLALPHAITRGIVPFLDLSPAEMQALHVYGFAIEYIVVLSYYCLQHLHTALQRLHNSIRDDRYLVGRQLNNFLNSHI